jgi:hypothetical protein
MSHDRDYADPGIKWNVMGCEDREPERGVSRGDRGNRSVDSDPGGERVIRGNFGPGGPKNAKFDQIWGLIDHLERSVIIWPNLAKK